MEISPSGRCHVCGRKARRICPALSSLICSACCGSSRGSDIECDPGCPHFPFGTRAYDLWLKVDDTWQDKAMGYVIQKTGREEFEKTAWEAAPDWEDEESAFFEGVSTAMLFYLTVNKDGELPLGEVWENEGFVGLNNDEQILTRYRRESRPTIIEIQKIVDDKAIECIDLLDSERGSFIIFDKVSAGSLSRFSRMLIWVTHYPYFSRMAGNGLLLPTDLVDEFIDILRDTAEQVSGDRTGEGVKLYLSSHLGEAFDLIEDMVDERRMRLIESMDADRCIVDYKLLVPRGEIETVMNGRPEFELVEDRQPGPGDPPTASYYVWLRRGESKRIEEMMPELARTCGDDESSTGILGTVTLTDDMFRFMTMGRRKFDFARDLADSIFKDMLEFRNESVTSIRQMIEELPEAPEKGPGRDSDKMPKEVEEEIMKKFYADRYEKFLDEPVPMIDNMTPRQAAETPSMRPRLIELIKQHLSGIDKMCAEKGMDIDVDWILDELGLDELKR